ncbi:MAG: outer membrane protein [Segetibacter sp.]|nr:outer membrane protein [Segetibacter sp.]
MIYNIIRTYSIAFTLLIGSLTIFFSCSEVADKSVEATVAIAVTPLDKELFTETFLNNLFAIRLSEEAITRSSLLETRQVAETILKDHATINNELVTFGGKRKIDQPLDITSAHLKMWQVLIREKGVNFDRKFLDMMTDVHEKTVKLFKTISNQASDEELKKIAATSIGTAGQHINLAAEAKVAIDARRSRDTLITNVADSPQY